MRRLTIRRKDSVLQPLLTPHPERPLLLRGRCEEVEIRREQHRAVGCDLLQLPLNLVEHWPEIIDRPINQLGCLAAQPPQLRRQQQVEQSKRSCERRHLDARLCDPEEILQDVSVPWRKNELAQKRAREHTVGIDGHRPVECQVLPPSAGTLVASARVGGVHPLGSDV
eukprot:795328-Prymnesium_polylepis.1